MAVDAGVPFGAEFLATQGMQNWTSYRYRNRSEVRMLTTDENGKGIYFNSTKKALEIFNNPATRGLFPAKFTQARLEEVIDELKEINKAQRTVVSTTTTTAAEGDEEAAALASEAPPPPPVMNTKQEAGPSMPGGNWIPRHRQVPAKNAAAAEAEDADGTPAAQLKKRKQEGSGAPTHAPGTVNRDAEEDEMRPPRLFPKPLTKVAPPPAKVARVPFFFVVDNPAAPAPAPPAPPPAAPPTDGAALLAVMIKICPPAGDGQEAYALTVARAFAQNSAPAAFERFVDQLRANAETNAA